MTAGRPKRAEEVPPTLATARILEATADRISRDVETLTGLTAKLRGLVFIDPEELTRLRAIELAARDYVGARHSDDIDAAEIRLRDSVADQWILNERASG